MTHPASDQPICPYVNEPCCDWEPQDDADVHGPGECIALVPEACPHNTGTDIAAIQQWQGREPLSDDPLPDALEMLKLPTDTFLEAVSRAISPKPWPHTARAVDAGEMPPVECVRCDEQWDSELMRRRDHSPCPVPPLIPDSLADVAERLVKQCQPYALLEATHQIPKGMGELISDKDVAIHFDWYIFRSTPQEKIACFLVALGHWRIGDGT